MKMPSALAPYQAVLASAHQIRARTGSEKTQDGAERRIDTPELYSAAAFGANSAREWWRYTCCESRSLKFFLFVLALTLSALSPSQVFSADLLTPYFPQTTGQFWLYNGVVSNVSVIDGPLAINPANSGQWEAYLGPIPGAAYNYFIDTNANIPGLLPFFENLTTDASGVETAYFGIMTLGANALYFPASATVGQTFTSSGSWTCTGGCFYTDNGNQSGGVTGGTYISTLQYVGFEDVRVPAGLFRQAAKVIRTFTLTSTQSMFGGLIQGSANWPLTEQDTEWYGNGVGLVKRLRNEYINESASGGSATSHVNSSDVEARYPGPDCKCEDSDSEGLVANPETGSSSENNVDFSATSSIPSITRNYDSRNNVAGSLGFGWRTQYDKKLLFAQTPAGSYAALIRQTGSITMFVATGGLVNNQPAFVPTDAGINGTLVVTASSGTGASQVPTAWSYLAPDDSTEVYNSTGQLVSIRPRGGLLSTLTYSTTTGTGVPAIGLLVQVSDPFGHALNFQYDNLSRISNITANGTTVGSYTYDASGNLATASYADGTAQALNYGEAADLPSGISMPNALTSVLDEGQVQFATRTYDSLGRLLSRFEPAGANLQSMQYTSAGSSTVTDALNTSRTVSYSDVLGITRVTGISTTSNGSLLSGDKSRAYDVQGNISSSLDFNCNLTCYSYDLNRNLETTRVEGFASGSSCPSNLTNYVPQSGTVQRKIVTSWNATFRVPSLIAIYAAGGEELRTTADNYNSFGNLLKRTITDMSVTPNVARTWTYTYDSYARKLTAVGPRTDITDKTLFGYYTCTTGVQCGELETITNALGQVTTFSSYNAYGQPHTVTDANNLVTTLNYDKRQRLSSSEIGTETTYYTYWPTGRLNLVTLPDSSTVQFSYDGAHRLTKITDGFGNYLQLTLDALGNITGKVAYDPSGVLHRSHTRAFSTLNQLSADINAAGTATVTTSYGYDNGSNQTGVDAPLSRNTTKGFDSLNRLNQVNDPNGGVTKLAYDALDNLASVVDPRSFTTSYSHNGFSAVTKIVSPDTGTSTKTYDSGGNLATTTDARRAVATYSYDALNRVTQVAYTDQTIALTYDAGTNGKGRLTGASDANHSLSWTYDTLGRVSGKGQTVAGVTKSVGYNYINGDLITITTPSGQTVTYGYTNHRITSIKIGSASLLSGVTYDPFGPPTAWTWGNSSTVSRAFDQDGNPHQIVTAGVTNGYTVDVASRITSITDSGLSTATWNFTSYDALDRIKAASSSAKIRGYTYDANGNRLTTTGSATSTETIATASNQLTATSGGLVRSYTYDAAGNTNTYTGETFNFNQRGRMSTATSTSATSYVYNALGQLIEKSGNGGTTLLMYDEHGHILGEYSSTGALIQETIWMDDLPVATIQPSGSSTAIYYVHTDHLGTPRKITNPSGNSVVWRWDPDTFGTVAPSTTIINYNLRFPGQYYLPESGLHYNYFRTYDPNMGRYIEADPTRLKGGINSYGYSGANPILFIDPLGLAAHLNEINATTNSQIELYNWAESYQPDDYNTIVVHGTSDGGFSPDASGPVRVSPEVLADELKEKQGYDSNLPTKLIACSAGSHQKSVQRLADALGAEVLASAQTLRSNPDSGGPPLAEAPGPSTLWTWLFGSSTLLQEPTWIPFFPH